MNDTQKNTPERDSDEVGASLKNPSVCDATRDAVASELNRSDLSAVHSVLCHDSIVLCMRSGNRLSFLSLYRTERQASHAFGRLQGLGLSPSFTGSGRQIRVSALFPKADIDRLSEKFPTIPKRDSLRDFREDEIAGAEALDVWWEYPDLISAKETLNPTDLRIAVEILAESDPVSRNKWFNRYLEALTARTDLSSTQLGIAAEMVETLSRNGEDVSRWNARMSELAEAFASGR